MLFLKTLGLLAGAPYAHPDALVNTDWLSAHAGDANVRVVDIRRGEFDAGHVPGAVYLQPEAIRDAKNAPTFMLSPAAFEAMMGRLGISNITHVVVYDERGASTRRGSDLSSGTSGTSTLR